MAEPQRTGELPEPLDDDDAARMPFLEHLRELRDRLRNAVIALLVGFVGAYAFSKDLFQWLAQPLADAYAKFPQLEDQSLNFLSMMEVLWVRLSISFWVGIFVASPFIFYQLWKFIAPGLYKHEQKVALPFSGLSGVFFIGGALFCYHFVLPVVWEFMLEYSLDEAGVLAGQGGVPIELAPMLTVDEYYSLAKRLMLGFGIVFELPLAIFFLSKIGAVTARGLWKFNRWWIVMSFILSAILTPPDPFSQTLMAMPLVLLYNVSILIAWLVEKSKRARGELID